MVDCKKIISSGLIKLNLPFNEQQIDKLGAFIELISKWNKAYNLTAIRDKKAMASLHILDSLAISPYLRGQRLIDIGTGAGLPAIPLAIFHPEIEFVLLDSNAKKTRFVQQAILELKLTNASVVHSRVENFKPKMGFDTVTCRAFSSMENIIHLSTHLFNKNGLLLAMKGQTPEHELKALPQNHRLIRLTIPEIEAERCLICIEPFVETHL